MTEESRYKQVLVATFHAFVSFCEANGLRYYAAYGTALGAVRHQGMIPWDDDIDVYMPRADYDRLLQITTPAGFGVMTLENTPGYWAPFAKWVNTNTTLWEEERQSVLIGLYIDIFVLDEAGVEAYQRIEEMDRIARQFRRANTGWKVCDLLEKALHFHPMGFWRLLLDKCWYSQRLPHYTRRLLQLQKACSEKVNKSDGEKFLVSYNGPYHQREIMRPEWFEDTVRMPFENFEVAVPVGYDTYLTQLYRNYMQFPPENKRKSTHSHFYLNLDKGMTIEEVKAELGMK